MKWCLKCGRPSAGARCAEHEADVRQVRTTDRDIARAVIEAAPWCHCTSRRCPHEGECGATEDLTADHDQPLSKGGTNDGPRTTMCRSCNSRKKARWQG